MTDYSVQDSPRSRGLDDAAHASPLSPSEDVRTIALNRISWGAVFAGVVVSLVAHLILNMIGIGVGAATLEPAAGTSPDASTFSMGAGIWFAATGIIAALLGGYAAGRLAGQPKESSASWHGLTTWALTTLVVFWLLTTTIGGLIGGTFSTLTNALGNAAGGAGAIAETTGGDPIAAIQEAIPGLGGGEQPGAGTQAEAEAALPSEQEVVQVADTAADAVATAALFGAASLLLGAVAGWFGGRLGTIAPTMTMVRGGTRSPNTPAPGHSRTAGRVVENRAPSHSPANGGDPRDQGNRL